MKALSFILFILPLAAYSGEPKYPVSSIPEELKKNVNIVVREDNMTYKILSRSNAILNANYVVTILNPKGKMYATKTVDYDKLTKINNLKGNLYDANGKLIRKIKSSEISDRSAYDGFSIYSDNRYKEIDLTHGEYPYTVEFEYEVEYKFLYGIDGTYLIPDENASVEHVSYKLIFPTDLAPRYKAVNIKVDPNKTKTPEGYDCVEWSFNNLLPIKIEPHGPRASEIVPHIIAAPGLFEYEGYAGDMSTWESYGQWKASVIKGRDILPESAKQKVKEVTKGLNSTEEKTKALYEYLQSKTRYVSIQLGIGGLQPFESSLVDQVGYGDCKALSNYMVAMLKEVGIKGYYTTVKAGEFRDDLLLDFPSHQSNHVIVAVPNGADTLWLECTSQTNPFGYAGLFTGDRLAFMITDNGGVWVHTPSYPAEINVQSRFAEVNVQSTGDATAKIKTVYAGLQYENDNLNFILNDQLDEQKEWVMKTTKIPSFDITSFKFVNKKDKIPAATVSLDLVLRHFANVSGKRLMITPNLMNRNTFIPEKNENRKSEIITRIGYVDIDTIKYKIPEELYPEFLPQGVKLTSKFGEYESTYFLEQGSIMYVRKLKIIKGKFPPNTYNEMVDFYKGISKADNQKLVFLSKT